MHVPAMRLSSLLKGLGLALEASPPGLELPEFVWRLVLQGGIRIPRALPVESVMELPQDLCGASAAGRRRTRKNLVGDTVPRIDPEAPQGWRRWFS